MACLKPVNVSQVRAYWNGSAFYSRNGLKFDAPAWFKKGLPSNSHLDGELWCGREQFERCVGIIKYHKARLCLCLH